MAWRKKQPFWNEYSMLGKETVSSGEAREQTFQANTKLLTDGPLQAGTDAGRGRCGA